MKPPDRSERQFEMPGVRYLLLVACCFGVMVNFSIRNNFNVALVAMINNTAVYHPSDNISISSECKVQILNYNSSTGIKDPNRDGEFSWSPKEQGILLGAYYYGYALFQVPYGRISEVHSSKWVFGLGTFISALLTLLTPLSARLHLIALIVLRALEGLAQGMMFPTIYVIISNWFPYTERNLILGIINCAAMVGMIVGMAATGYICHSTLLGGWPTVFYIMGGLGSIWFIFWWIVSADNPSIHPFIMQDEINYITLNQNKELKEKIPLFPWRKVFTSVPFWAYMISHFANDWVYFVVFNDIPTYFGTILHFDIQKNGFLSAIPNVLPIMIYIFAGAMSDFLIRRNIMKVKNIRKCIAVFCSVISSFFLMGVGLAGCNEMLAVTSLVCCVALISLRLSGDWMTPLDMSPEYSGTLNGIANSISTLNGFIVPITIGYITNEQQTLEKWRLVFGMSAAIQGTGGLIFILFSSSEKQNWIDK